MKEIKLGYSEFYISDEVFVELYGRTPEEREMRQRDIIYCVGGDLKELILAAQVPLAIRNRFKILHAHEGISGDEWLYEDGGQGYPVQTWVNTMDGTASVLMIACCNTYNFGVTAKRSSVIYPTGTFSLYKAMYGEVKFRTSTPHS